jgi:hypothetical protein
MLEDVVLQSHRDCDVYTVQKGAPTVDLFQPWCILLAPTNTHLMATATLERRADGR